MAASWHGMLPGMARALPAAGRPDEVLAHIGPGTDIILPLANGEPARPRRLLLARHERRLRRVADRQGPVLPRGQRADAAHLRPQPDPRLAAARLLHRRSAARRGPARHAGR